MKFRRRPSPLLLLLLPAIASGVAVKEIPDATIPSNLLQRNTQTEPEATPLIDLTAKSKYEIGTKAAPVDGKDGMPHAGPWVGTDKDSKTDKTAKKGDEKEELVVGKEDLTKKLKTADGSKIPDSNDGVMDDKHRVAPKEGTRGTEGGVSEKDKVRKAKEGETGEKAEKTPGSPKEAPVHPDDATIVKDETTEKKLKDVDVKAQDTAESLAGLEKPKDLPTKSSSDPHPIPASANKDHLDIPTDKKTSTPLTPVAENEGLIQPLHSYLLSLTMILFSEIGDKTFLVAALMAMKHDRLLVFSAAFSALFVMTILSAVLGHAVPTLIPKKFTNFLAAGLFLVFGGRLLKEGLAMSPDEGVTAEMQEVEQELEEKEHLARKAGRRRSSISPYALEMGMGRNHTRKSRSGSRLPSPPRSPSSSPDRSPSPPRSAVAGALGGLNNLLGLLLSPAWVQTFVMTFLGEWGDRSQIATIAMAAGQDYWWVTGGAVSGHAVCTGVAVIGGRAIAGKVSLRVVTLGGAFAFLVFGVIYLVEALWYA